MYIIDTLIRAGTVGVALLLGIVLLSDPMTRRRAWSTLAMAATASCYLVASSPFADLLPALSHQGAILGAIMMTPAFAWLVLDIFMDGPTRRWPWLVFAALAIPASYLAGPYPVFEWIRGSIVIGLYLSLLAVAVISGPDDLVEKRRRFRPVFLTAMVVLGLAITLTELFVDQTILPPVIFLGLSLSFFVMTLAFAIWALRPETGIWDVGMQARAGNVRAAAEPDTQLIAVLNKAMGAEIWRREGLTIGALASELAVPEHRLRAVINRELGYRNFSAFINGYRINAAMTELRVPENTGKTILEIAYESGFASLGPFNKAFRAQTGQSPRDYRTGLQ